MTVRIPTHELVGLYYRGVLSPFVWKGEDRSVGVAPDGDVYPLAVP